MKIGEGSALNCVIIRFASDTHSTIMISNCQYFISQKIAQLPHCAAGAAMFGHSTAALINAHSDLNTLQNIVWQELLSTLPFGKACEGSRL